jgi:hypothetical protein
MVYFPVYRLLYTSDTLVMHDDGTLYDPQLMNEVIQAVKRVFEEIYLESQNEISDAEHRGQNRESK